MRVSVSGRTRLAVVAIALVVLGCGAASSGSSSSGGQGGTVVATETDNGRTIGLASGAHLIVTLHSTYWSFAGISNSAVLQQVGQPNASPGSCPPGIGCGQVTATFTAVGPGRADVTASRSSCGEALSCTGGAGSFRVTVVVSG
jgi:hypothetical protein